jgi:hypothetical protein
VVYLVTSPESTLRGRYVIPYAIDQVRRLVRRYAGLLCRFEESDIFPRLHDALSRLNRDARQMTEGVLLRVIDIDQPEVV